MLASLRRVVDIINDGGAFRKYLEDSMTWPHTLWWILGKSLVIS
jgi:hypothetical protein